MNLSLSCGEIPHGEHLPRSCKNVGMPATFLASREGADENQEDDEDEEVSQKTLVKYLVKFFQNGDYSIEGPRWRLRVDVGDIWPNFDTMDPWYRALYFDFFRNHGMSRQRMVAQKLAQFLQSHCLGVPHNAK